MQRQINPCRAVARPIIGSAVKDKLLSNPHAWLEEQAKAHAELQLQYFLAYADDGVIWGQMRASALVTSDNVTDVSPPLREATLQQARLFSQQGELFLWRDGDNHWNARLLYETESEDNADWIEAYDEPQMLWGTHGEHRDGFTLLKDGAQGLRHAVPLLLPLDEHDPAIPSRLLTPPRLLVRHYLAQDDFARVEVSRLVNLGENPCLGLPIKIHP